MPDILRRSARAVLLDGGDLVLMKRTRPGRDPYWTTVGGGVKKSDAGVEAALHREVFEELGGTLARAELVYLVTDALEGGIGVQYVFAARLAGMDVSVRTGTEFSKPERGLYEIVRVPFTAEGVRGVDLLPRPLADYVAANVDAISSVLTTTVHSP